MLKRNTRGGKMQQNKPSVPKSILSEVDKTIKQNYPEYQIHYEFWSTKKILFFFSPLILSLLAIAINTLLQNQDLILFFYEIKNSGSFISTLVQLTGSLSAITVSIILLIIEYSDITQYLLKEIIHRELDTLTILITSFVYIGTNLFLYFIIENFLFISQSYIFYTLFFSLVSNLWILIAISKLVHRTVSILRPENYYHTLKKVSLDLVDKLERLELRSAIFQMKLNEYLGTYNIDREYFYYFKEENSLQLPITGTIKDINPRKLLKIPAIISEHSKVTINMRCTYGFNIYTDTNLLNISPKQSPHIEKEVRTFLSKSIIVGKRINPKTTLSDLLHKTLIESVKFNRPDEFKKLFAITIEVLNHYLYFELPLSEKFVDGIFFDGRFLIDSISDISRESLSANHPEFMSEIIYKLSRVQEELINVDNREGFLIISNILRDLFILSIENDSKYVNTKIIDAFDRDMPDILADKFEEAVSVQNFRKAEHYIDVFNELSINVSQMIITAIDKSQLDSMQLLINTLCDSNFVNHIALGLNPVLSDKLANLKGEIQWLFLGIFSYFVEKYDRGDIRKDLAINFYEILQNFLPSYHYLDSWFTKVYLHNSYDKYPHFFHRKISSNRIFETNRTYKYFLSYCLINLNRFSHMDKSEMNRFPIESLSQKPNVQEYINTYNYIRHELSKWAFFFTGEIDEIQFDLSKDNFISYLQRRYDKYANAVYKIEIPEQVLELIQPKTSPFSEHKILSQFNFLLTQKTPNNEILIPGYYLIEDFVNLPELNESNNFNKLQSKTNSTLIATIQNLLFYNLYERSKQIKTNRSWSSFADYFNRAIEYYNRINETLNVIILPHWINLQSLSSTKNLVKETENFSWTYNGIPIFVSRETPSILCISTDGIKIDTSLPEVRFLKYTKNEILQFEQVNTNSLLDLRTYMKAIARFYFKIRKIPQKKVYSMKIKSSK